MSDLRGVLPVVHMTYADDGTMTEDAGRFKGMDRFACRKAVVEALEALRGAAATGIGGIGKSQLAVEFCHRYGRFFQGVHWIQANQDILAEVRYELAREYLSTSSLPLEEISVLLGYSAPGNFSNAFKRWHGSSPRSFRQEKL